jgi:hypothetical protein
MLFKKICMLFLIVLGLSACSLPAQYTDINIILDPAKDINDGVLLPLDVLAIDAGSSEAALGVGPDNWFGEDLRDRLTGDEIKRLAISGGIEKSVLVKISEGVNKIIIFADFENNSDRVGQQIVIVPEKLNFLSKYRIKINEDTMELAK